MPIPKHPAATGKLVLIHGIWMTGFELRWLGRRLAACGFEVHYFRYPSRQASPPEQARHLAQYLDRIAPGQPLHLVAHSLGGLLVLWLLEQYPQRPLGRILLLGSPVRGSGVAARLVRHAAARWLLGRAWRQGLDGEVPRAAAADHEIGIIAGTKGLGMGRLIGGLSRPNDGTVALAETRMSEVPQRLELPVSHFGMLFSSRVAKAACRFLGTGRLGG